MENILNQFMDVPLVLIRYRMIQEHPDIVSQHSLDLLKS